jgi:pimeloyl-ACP methyl ester carboxylesterase
MLSCRVSGKGPPLVLIHGAGNFSARWNPVIPILEQHYSIYALDRRGRGESGESGDGAPYALEREFEDAARVVDAIGGSVNLLGHSLGAVCAVEAALQTRNIRRLILYEPPLPVGVQLVPDGILKRLDGLLKNGDREGIVTTMMLDIIRMPAGEVERQRCSPAWKDRLAVAHTLPRELRAIDAYEFDAARFREVTIPTLLLLGEKSPLPFTASIEALASVLPNARTVVLRGQQHIAIDTAPELFSQEVLAFLRS